MTFFEIHIIATLVNPRYCLPLRLQQEIIMLLKEIFNITFVHISQRYATWNGIHNGTPSSPPSRRLNMTFLEMFAKRPKNPSEGSSNKLSDGELFQVAEKFRNVFVTRKVFFSVGALALDRQQHIIRR